MTTITDRMRRKGRRRFIETYEFPPALHAKLVEELGTPTRPTSPSTGCAAGTSPASTPTAG